jgi:hypothetical protein
MARSLPSRVCLFWTRILLRLVQFGSSLVAYVLLRTAVFSYQNTAGGQSVAVVVSSGPLNFARIINFLAFVYAFAFLVFVEWLRLCVYPVNYCEKVMDLVLLACLVIATLVLLLSNMALHCGGRFDRFVHCGEVYVAIALSFLSTLAFLGTVMIGRREDAARQRAPDREAQHQHSDRGSATYAHNESPRAGSTPVPVVTAQPAQR